MYDFKYEHFNSIYEFEKALNSRPVNKLHSLKQSSQKRDYAFSQTESYEEADGLLKNGWNAQVENIEKELKKFSNTIRVNHNRQVKSVAGYAPCVANAIRGVPKSMFSTKKIERNEKRKSVHIIINNIAHYKTESSELMKAGLTVLKLSMMLDRMGIRTKIDMVPIMSSCGYSCYGCTVSIKDYRQPFNISKIAYPVAHVAFFRRHGFKYYETMKGFSNEAMARNYGYDLSISGDRIKKAYMDFAGFKKDGVVYIDFEDCKMVGFDYSKLAEDKGISLE